MAVLMANDGFSGGLKASLHKPDIVLLDLIRSVLRASISPSSLMPDRLKP